VAPGVHVTSTANAGGFEDQKDRGYIGVMAQTDSSARMSIRWERQMSVALEHRLKLKRMGALWTGTWPGIRVQVPERWRPPTGAVLV